MRVHVVSDVHGTTDALARAGDGADMLICLGDMLLFLDYADHTQGIFAELYGAEHAREYIALRAARRFDEARRLTAAIAARITAERGSDLRTLTEQAIRRQYAALFDALAEPAYLTYGNVDVPRLWDVYRKPGHRVIDGGRVVAGGIAFGFVGAGLISPYRTPNEVGQAEFAAKLAAVGTVDVICTHIPPAVPELLYDTVARRLETGSVALLEVIRATQPRYALFGHVHNPLARRVRIGRTECVNVGHFRATRAPYVVELLSPISRGGDPPYPPVRGRSCGSYRPCGAGPARVPGCAADPADLIGRAVPGRLVFPGARPILRILSAAPGRSARPAISALTAAVAAEE